MSKKNEVVSEIGKELMALSIKFTWAMTKASVKLAWKGTKKLYKVTTNKRNPIVKQVWNNPLVSLSLSAIILTGIVATGL